MSQAASDTNLLPARRYSLQEIVCPSEWRRLAARTVSSHMTQTWAFGEAKRAMKWQPHRLVFKQGDEPIAICQALRRSLAGIPVLTRINHGPLLLSGHADRAMGVLRAIRSHWCHFRRGFLFIAPDLPYSEESLQSVLEMGFRLRCNFRWASSVLDLSLAEVELRKALSQKWRNRLCKAEGNGLRFTVGNSCADLEWMLEKHVAHMAEKGFEGPAPALVRALYEAAPSDFLVFRVWRREAVAGMVAYRFGDVAHAYLSWNGPEGRGLNAGNFMFWNAALELRRRGCTRFDLGGHNKDVGFGAFKRGLNGIGYELLGEFACV